LTKDDQSSGYSTRKYRTNSTPDKRRIITLNTNFSSTSFGERYCKKMVKSETSRWHA